jgi:hypothetical protein
MNRGATTWFRMFGTIVWNLLIIEPFFHWFLKNQDWELYWNLGVFLIVGKLSPSFNFVILRPKMWKILLSFWWVHIVDGNSKKLQKKVWKEDPNECIQTWANDIGYISV